MRKRRTFYNVTDCINACYIRFIIIVNNNFSFIGFHTGFFQANAFEVGGNANGREYDVGFKFDFTVFCFYGSHTTFTCRVNLCYLCIHMNRNTGFLERLL